MGCRWRTHVVHSLYKGVIYVYTLHEQCIWASRYPVCIVLWQRHTKIPSAHIFPIAQSAMRLHRILSPKEHTTLTLQTTADLTGRAAHGLQVLLGLSDADLGKILMDPIAAIRREFQR